MEQKLAKHGLMMIIFSLTSAFFNYLYQFFMGRLLSPEEYGVLFSLINIFYIFNVLSSTVQNTMAKYTSQLKAKNLINNISYLWRYMLKKSLAFGIITTLCFFAITPFLSDYLHIPSITSPLILFSSLLFAYTLPTNQGVMQGLQRFISLGITNVLWSFIKFSLGVFLVYEGFSVNGALFPFLGANTIIFFLSLIFIKDIIKTPPKQFEISELYKYSILTLVGLLAYSTLYSIDTILAKHYLNEYFAGIYSSISVVGKIILFAPGGIAIVLFPKVSELKEKGFKHFDLFIKALLLMIVITFPLLILFYLFPKQTIEILFGTKYLEASPYLWKYGLAMFFISISGLIMNYLLSLGITRISYVLFLTLIVEVTGIFLFHKNISQIIDMVLISSIISIVMEGVMIYSIKKYLLQGS